MRSDRTCAATHWECATTRVAQSDGLYLACRGESIGELTRRHWDERPLVFVTVLLVVLLSCAAWLRQQARIFASARAGAGKGEDEDEDEDDGDEDEEDEAEEDENEEDEAEEDEDGGKGAQE